MTTTGGNRSEASDRQRLFDYLFAAVEARSGYYERLKSSLIGVFHSRSGREAWFEVKNLPFAYAELKDFLQVAKAEFLQADEDAGADLARLLRSWEIVDPEHDEQHVYYMSSQLDQIVGFIEAGDWDGLQQDTRRWRSR